MEINDEPPPPHHRGATAAAAASSAAATAMASVAASLKTAAAGSAEQMQMLRKVITPKANANAAAAAAANNNNNNNNNNNSHIFHSSFPPLSSLSSSPSSPSSLSPPLSPLSPSSAVTSSAYRWNTTTTSTSGSDSSVINLWAPGNGSSDNSSSSSSSSLVTTNIVTAFKNFHENSSRTIADLQSHLGSDWNDWSSSSGENFTGGRGTSITSDSFSYFSNTGGNYTPFLNGSSGGVNQQEALLTWWDVWLGKPFPSGYTQLAIVLLAFFLTCIMILVVVGNLLVCIAIATEKSLKPVQNWFIASLAVSDLLIGLVIMPFSLARELMGYWMFGQIWCDVHAALDVLLCTASINSLFLISLDRYWSITQAVKYLKKRTPSRAAFMIAFVWIFSALVSLPPLVGWKKAEQSSEYPQCNLSDDIGYVLYSSIGSFYFPALMMVFVYIRIFIAARSRARKHIAKKRQIIGSKTPQNDSSNTTANTTIIAANAAIHHHNDTLKEKSYSTTVGTTTSTTSFSNSSPPIENLTLSLVAQNNSSKSGGVRGDPSNTTSTTFTCAAAIQVTVTSQHNQIPDSAQNSSSSLPPLPPLPKSPPPPQIIIEASDDPATSASRRQSWNIISTSELMSSISIISGTAPGMGGDPLQNPQNFENNSGGHCLRADTEGGGGGAGNGNGCHQAALSSSPSPSPLHHHHSATCSTVENSDVEPEESTGGEAEAEAEAQRQLQQQQNKRSSTSSLRKVYFPSLKAAGKAFRGFRRRSSRLTNGGNGNGQLGSSSGGSKQNSLSRSQMSMGVDEDSDTADSPTSKEHPAVGNAVLKSGDHKNHISAPESKAFLSAPQLLRSKFGSSLSIADYELECSELMEEDSGGNGSGSGSGKKGSGKNKLARLGYHPHHHHDAPMGMVHLPSDAERHKRKIAKARERRATLIVGLIMAAFITAWLPFFVLYLLAALCATCNAVIPGGVFAVAFWLGYCNSAANPIIYTIFNRDYRKAFRKILFK